MEGGAEVSREVWREVWKVCCGYTDFALPYKSHELLPHAPPLVRSHAVVEKLRTSGMQTSPFHMQSYCGALLGAQQIGSPPCHAPSTLII